VNANFDPLLQEVAQRDILEEVWLFDTSNSNARVPSVQNRPFLRSIQQNTSITAVHLIHLLVFGNDVATLLDNSSSLSTFRMECCTVESQEGAAAIAAALGRSTRIKSLELACLATEFVVAILERLRHNGSVKKLGYGWHHQLRHDKELLALEALVTSTTTIEELQIADSRFTALQFQPICQGLVQSQSVTALSLICCKMRGEEFNPLFQALFRTKLNLYSLHVNDCHFERGNFFDSLLENLLRKNSALKNLNFSGRGDLDGNVIAGILA